MSNLFYEHLQEQSDGIDLRKFAIEELEKIKREFEDRILLNQTVAIQIMDKYISELKGEQK